MIGTVQTWNKRTVQRPKFKLQNIYILLLHSGKILGQAAKGLLPHCKPLGVILALYWGKIKENQALKE